MLFTILQTEVIVRPFESGCSGHATRLELTYGYERALATIFKATCSKARSMLSVSSADVSVSGMLYFLDHSLPFS